MSTPEPGGDAPVAVARLFDTRDPAGRPGFVAGHPRLDDPRELAATLEYLRAGTLLLIAPEWMDDVVEPARGRAVPMAFRTDGAWVWTDAHVYYLAEYRLAPDPGLLAHVRRQAGPVPVPDAAALDRALAAVTLP